MEGPDIKTSVAGALPAAVGVDDVDPDLLAIRQCRHDRAQCTRGASLASDHTTEILRIHTNFEQVAAAG